MLSACTVDQVPLTTAEIINDSCPLVSRCTIPGNNLTNNQSLLNDYNALKKAWLFCAAQVDMIADCQDNQNEKTRTAP
ncbi:Rz1-like lysis system protein LysC [Utexia brackfieldae]|uniref:Rz1-like lysis system protein LysC n=1 Tax=Utexia brackfieldae TaxID=3074108 RepID=UPI00370D56AC